MTAYIELIFYEIIISENFRDFIDFGYVLAPQKFILKNNI